MPVYANHTTKCAGESPVHKGFTREKWNMDARVDARRDDPCAACAVAEQIVKIEHECQSRMVRLPCRRAAGYTRIHEDEFGTTVDAGTVGQAVGNDGMERKTMVDARFGFKRLGTERNRLLGAAVYEQSGVGQDRGLKRERCEQAVRRPVRDPDLRFGPVRRE